MMTDIYIVKKKYVRKSEVRDLRESFDDKFNWVGK